MSGKIELTPAAVAALKPCPFCGLKGKLLRGKKRNNGEWLWKPAVGCTPCGFHREFDSAEAAIAWWNYREPRKSIPLDEFKTERGKPALYDLEEL